MCACYRMRLIPTAGVASAKATRGLVVREFLRLLGSTSSPQETSVETGVARICWDADDLQP